MSLLGTHHTATCERACESQAITVARLIQQLQHCPNWRVRDDAAHELRRFAWKCHPGLAEALATALVTDPEEEVREEAAESLKVIKPCLPIVQSALERAANCDRDFATRHQARKALRGLGHCSASCSWCGVKAPQPIANGPILVPLDPYRGVPVQPGLPPSDPPIPLEGPLPPAIPDANSPFSPTIQPIQPAPRVMVPTMFPRRLPPARVNFAPLLIGQPPGGGF